MLKNLHDWGLLASKYPLFLLLITTSNFQIFNTMKKVTLVLALALVALLFASCKKENKIEQQIIGKWITTDVDGHAELTNNKSVITFLSPTQAVISTSRANLSENQGWASHLNASVVLDGNKVTLSFQPNAHITIIYDITVRSITDTNMEGTFMHNTLRDGEVISTNGPMEMRWVKVNADYQQAVIGLWECTELTGIETYNDANARLEFFDDGTYNYWRKNDAGEWEAVTDREFQEYFVDGILLATRWKVIGEPELREWWEIASIADNQMVWTAQRKNADGTTVQQGMKWVKVN